ncbi:MAG: hypothetical protein N2509_04135, partial [Treponemataceae bacterium]|nr:hypothetical protein [Treponemataceae bacterium]
MYKKIPLVMALVLMSVAMAISQVVHDPNDQLYQDIDRWYVEGYITTALPQVRPYPAQFILFLLDEVLDHGDVHAQEKATAYRKAVS